MINILDKQTIQLLNELGRKHFTSLMDYWGVAYSDRGSYINAKCPIDSHPGDNDNLTAFSFRYDTGQWACWTHHCEDTVGRDIIGLVMGVENLSFNKAVIWLRSFLEKILKMSIDDIDVNTIDIQKKKSQHIMFIHKPLPESILYYLSKDISYLINRGFDPKILKMHQVGYWSRFGTYMHERIIIPIRDVEGRLIGFTGRSIYEKEAWLSKYNPKNDPKIKYSKWLHGRGYVKKSLDIDFHKNSVIVNLNNVRDKFDRIILVEGPLDGFKLEMAGISYWGGCLGSAVSPIQQHLLLQANIRKIILAFDPDDAGKTCTKKALDLMSNNFDIDVINIPKPYDIGALSIDTIRSLIKI